MVEDAVMATALDEFAAAVTGDVSAEDLLQRLALAATQALGVDAAGVMAPAGQRLLRFVYATTEGSRDLGLLQEVTGEGPCAAAAASGEVINIADLAAEGAWPEFRAGAVRDGFRAVTTIPLRARGNTWGVLDLYRKAPVGLSDEELAAARRLANLATSYLVVTADRDAARAAQSDFAYRAMHDPLTGLPVRSVFLEQLAHALTRLQRHRDHSIAVLFLDIDGLKYVNDTHGHECGDELLVTCVARTRAALRPADVLARIGGDEFVVLLEDLADMGAAIAVSQRIIDGLGQPYVVDGARIRPSVSIGIAVTNEADADPAVLIAHADSAMYAAKHAGRGLYRLFNPAAYDAERTNAATRGALLAALRHALEAGEFDVHYQPIVDLTRCRHSRHDANHPCDAQALWAVEALVRWHHPHLGLLPASEFISIAEASGLIVELGAWVLRTACRQLATWDRDLRDAAPARLFVNVSAAELSQPAFARGVGAALEGSGVAAARLTLEITETGLFAEPTAASLELRRLAELGCHLAIDDFGTGYSSLSRLLEIPAATLKIDHSFTQALRTHRAAAAVVSSVLLLGRNLSRTVVAEGVEDGDILSALRELGATHAQGFLLGRPQSPADLTPYLTATADTP